MYTHKHTHITYVSPGRSYIGSTTKNKTDVREGSDEISI